MAVPFPPRSVAWRCLQAPPGSADASYLTERNKTKRNKTKFTVRINMVTSVVSDNYCNITMTVIVILFLLREKEKRKKEEERKQAKRRAEKRGEEKRSVEVIGT